MRKRSLVTVATFVALILASLGCGLVGRDAAQVSATPTKTMRPLFTSTFTPTPSPPVTEAVASDTPLPSDTIPPPTDTPLPTEMPTPEMTATGAAPSEPPPPTEAVPSDTPPPTNTPQPQPTNTPAPPTNTPGPQVDYRVVEQRLMSKAENEAQRHMVLIRVIDAGGSPLSGIVVWDPNHPQQEAETGTKPGPYDAEYLFWDYDGYQLEVRGASSEKTKVLSTDVQKIPIEDLVAAGYCSDASSCNPSQLVQHFCWYVTFQRTW